MGGGLLILLIVAFGIGFVGIWLLEEADDPVPGATASYSGEVTVYVVTESWHSAVVVPQPPGASLGPPGARRAPWLEYGWGERDFWRARAPGAFLATKAALLASPSVVRILARPEPPSATATRRVFRRRFSAAQAAAILNALEAPLARDEAGLRCEPLQDLDWMSGTFYPSRRRYVWWRNCNVHTLRALERADEAHSALGVIHAAQVADGLVGFQELSPP